MPHDSGEGVATPAQGPFHIPVPLTPHTSRQFSLPGQRRRTEPWGHPTPGASDSSPMEDKAGVTQEWVGGRR